ncbi:hypothetical protein ABET51_00045 [Metabacillus fastidiosus]|uniref:hypothetical protein n=1 Tax=Metabacillus fastidiosus TaxID=1458 RepID=UPI002E1DB811|nr:hypothetical protein [Metabacillus fastidiosus]
MKYYVIEADELNASEETIYVFEHTKIRDKYNVITSLEDFAATCQFIEARNSYMYWYKGKGNEEVAINEVEKRIRNEQKELKAGSKEEFIKVRNTFSNIIKPFTFPNNPIRSAYAYEPEWNDQFFVIETEESFFALYWFTAA